MDFIEDFSLKTPKSEQHECIYCGGTPVTSEHMFGQWLARIRPTAPYKGARIRRQEKDGNIETRIHFDKEKPKSVLWREVRRACQKCNSEWLGDIQTRVQPVITALMKDEPIELGEVELDALVSWATNVTMMYEFTDSQTIAISDAEYKEFFSKRKPPSNWRIWIGRHSSDHWADRPVHVGAALGTRQDKEMGTHVPTNTQTTLITVGSLIIFVASSSKSEFDQFKPKAGNNTLIKIWPREIANVSWPCTFAIPHEGMDILAYSLLNSSRKQIEESLAQKYPK